MKRDLHIPPDIPTIVADTSGTISAHSVARSADLSDTTANEYLGRMARRGELARRGPGLFTMRRGGPAKLEPTPLLKRASSAIRRELPMATAVGWTTEWLARYAHNVPTRHWTVIEAAPYALTSLADALARDHLRAVINPSPGAVSDLLRLFDHPLILWPHGDTYAAPPKPGLRWPRSERLVVDLYFAVTHRGLPYPDNDLAVVIARFVTERDLNIASILAYAKRRRIDVEMSSYLRSLNRLPTDVAEAVELVTNQSHMTGGHL